MKLNLYSFTVSNGFFPTISGTIPASNIKKAREELKKTYSNKLNTKPDDLEIEIEQIEKLVIYQE
ncbi:hypothetical protein [Bacillus licheniformis]|uniref:hypothetical protein n=1 Tax=Bacillus licheniformis TaxID=1402 RepID=UPI0011A7FD5F|nr:hypothetical protein [Bacillus licheniformis]TWL46273.1 hypothetical protein CHCC15543_4544 [Bacillus licheniformis]